MRVKKCVPNCSSPTTTTIYVFVGGKVIAEYDNGAAIGSPSRENIYSGGTQIAKIAGSTTTYYHQDHLSNRLVTSSSGSVVEQMGHLPYGENWYDTGGEKWKFTTFERDAESGNDYALARYDVNRLGRFTSPDPLSGSTANPQSLNHYTYVGNDPINATDPTGQSEMDATNNCFDVHITFANAACDNDTDCAGEAGCDPNSTPWDINGPGGAGDSGGGMGGCVEECTPDPPDDGDPTSAADQIANAQALAAYIIATDPSCGDFFGVNMGLDGATDPDAVAALLANATITTENQPIVWSNPTPSASDPNVTNYDYQVAAAHTPSGGNIQINTGTGSPFFSAGAVPPVACLYCGPPPTFSSIGGINTGTPQFQVLTILHEFAHVMGLLTPDANSAQASGANTQAILDACGGAIASATSGSGGGG
jgi:RHS repeat-associated protein